VRTCCKRCAGGGPSPNCSASSWWALKESTHRFI
jgi:hypothetical protein